MAITGWGNFRPLRPCRPTAYVNPTVTDRDTSLRTRHTNDGGSNACFYEIRGR